MQALLLMKPIAGDKFIITVQYHLLKMLYNVVNVVTISSFGLYKAFHDGMVL
jgi:hypothetical protein